MNNDVNAVVNDNGETLLILAAREGNLQKVRDLVTNGALIDQSNDDEKHTPMHDAAANGHLDVIRYLVEAGADMEREDYFGSTPLIRAAQQGHTNVVEYLLDMHAKESSYGETAMLQASSNGHLAVVQLLVERGSDPNETNNEGHVALHEACWYVVQLLSVIVYFYPFLRGCNHLRIVILLAITPFLFLQLPYSILLTPSHQSFPFFFLISCDGMTNPLLASS